MVRIDTSSWWFSAGIVALGLPVLAGGGLGATALVGIALERTRFASMVAPWQVWLAGFAVAVVLMWFLTRFALRRSGWKALAAGIGISVVVAVACWFVGDVVARYNPHSMAGVGWGILAFAIGIYSVVGALVGLVVGATESSKRVSKETGSAS